MFAWWYVSGPNCRGLFHTVKEVLPDMRAAGSGNIVIIGATASIKGGANFAPFASAKAAQRGLAQSLARYLVYFLTQQPSQAWTFELDLRPFSEKW